MYLLCRDKRNSENPCANVKDKRCVALYDCVEVCAFYKPKEQWQRELSAMMKREAMKNGKNVHLR